MANHIQEKTKNPRAFRILLTLAVVAILALTAYNALRPSETTKVLAGSVVPAPEKTGPAGPQGPAGQGSVGATGKTGVAGKSVAGPKGVAGHDGQNGINGIGIAAITCNPDTTWGFTMSDGSTQTVAGPCSATNGSQGPQGSPPVSWTYVDAYGLRYYCYEAPSFSPSSPQYACAQGVPQ